MRKKNYITNKVTLSQFLEDNCVLSMFYIVSTIYKN